MENIKINYSNKEYTIPYYSTPLDLINKYKLKIKSPVAAIVNGHLTRLNKHIKVDSNLQFIERNTHHGKKIYESSLLLLFLAAFKKKFPKLNVFIQHSIDQGVFAEIKERPLNAKEILVIENEMKKLVKNSIDIVRESVDWEVYMNRMMKIDRTDMINLLRYHTFTLIKTYRLEDVEENLYLPVLPNTKFINKFALKKYQSGIALLYPNFDKTDQIKPFRHSPKLFKTYQEYHEWSRILKIRTVGNLNKHIMMQDIKSLIRISEALHEKRISNIADEIAERKNHPRVILIAGPSSSGKTTFSKRLEIQLRVNGLNTQTLNLDNYFVARENTPKDKDGNYDFDSLGAIDVPLFKQHLRDLLKYKTVDIPIFDFRSGRRKPKGSPLTLEKNQIIIIEGIHGLNPKLTQGIDEKLKFKIYVSALTQLNLHRHDRIPTTDTRLIRRIVRDSLFRGYTASETLQQWKSVRVGEDKNIFPYQEKADVIFNSALFYELSVLKPHAERELLKAERSNPMYAEARRLLKFLSYFLPLEAEDIPSTSILKEFIGNSSFIY